MQGARPVGQLGAAGHQLPRAVGQLARAVDQVAGAVVEGLGPVGELPGAVGGLADAVVHAREAHVDLAQVLLEHARAQRLRQRRAHRFREVAAHVVDRVVRGDGQQRGRGLLDVPAERGDVRREVRGDLDGRAVGAVRQALVRLLGGGLHEAVDGRLVHVQQGVGELRAHVQIGFLAVRRGGGGALVLVDHGGGDLVEVVAGIQERPGHVAGVDHRDQGEAHHEQCRDGLLPLTGQQGHRSTAGRRRRTSGAAEGTAECAGDGAGGRRDGARGGAECSGQGAEDCMEKSHHDRHDTLVYRD